MSEVLYKFLAERRSAGVLVEPAPSRAEIKKILQVAGTVPDHGKLMPYRFVVFEGDSREKFAMGLVNAANENRHEPLDEKLVPKIKAKAYAAPLQVLIIFSPLASEKIPDWEQMAAASCTGYALGLAANSLGYGAVWKSFAYDTGSELDKIIGRKPEEKILGWVNIGTEKNRSHSPLSPMDFDKHVSFV